MGGGWTSVRLDEIEQIAVDDDKLLWRPLRRTLGVEAFGINAYTAPNAGDQVVEEHTEAMPTRSLLGSGGSPPTGTPRPATTTPWSPR